MKSAQARRWRGVAAGVVRFGLAGLLLYAAWPKMGQPVEFAQAIANYRLLPGQVVVWVAWVLPWLEVLVALALCGPRRWRAGGWSWAVVLFTVFALAQFSAWWRGLDITCGCFGGAGKIDGVGVALRAALALLAAAGWWCDTSASSGSAHKGRTDGAG